jgi:hypothetical protein
LLGYPFINDGVSTFKSNPYGQKSIEIGDSAYKTFAVPVMPYFSKPYQFVSPYIKKADSLGDMTLSKVDERFPVVKKPTGELYEDARNLVMMPYRVSLAGKDHVLSTYSTEKKKVGGENLMTYGKAIITTALIITSETVTSVSSYLTTKKEGVKNSVDEKANN